MNSILQSSQSQFFSSNLINHLCSYLNYKDLILFMITSKKIYLIIDDYLRYFLKNQKNISIDAKKIFDRNGNVLGPSDMHKFNLIYKHFYYQELKVTNLIGKEFEPSNNSILKSIFHKGIKEFTIGHKFSGFLTYKNELFFAKTSEFLDPKYNVLAEKKQIKCFSAYRNIVYLTELGQIFIVFYQKNVTTLELSEDLILMTLHSPIENFFSSYNFIIMLHKTSDEQEIYIYDLLDFDLKKINEENRMKRLLTTNCSEFQGILSCCVGSNVCYFLSNENNLYFCDLKSIIFDRLTKEKLELSLFVFFKSKQITQIYSSFLSYFAIEQEKIQSIDQWDNKLVLEWATNVGFIDCVKLLKFHKITGNDLLLIDRKFLNDTLGIKSEEIQNRFLKEIEKKKIITYKPTKLYAWGNNLYGQLGCFNNNAANPTKVNLPNFSDGDEIEKIEIGWKMTAILTKKKKLWISESNFKSKQPLIIDNHHENNNEKVSKRKGSDKVKEEKKFLVFNSSSNSKNHRWIDVTDFYSKTTKVNYQNIRDVSISKETFVVMVSSDYSNENNDVYRKNSGKSSDYIKKNKKALHKMKSAVFIIQQLRWNQNLQKNQWCLGMEVGNDAFELSFVDFDQKEGYFGLEDIVIRYFKKEGEIIWDKHNKIDNF